ncbi:MAG: hypothetical protein KJ749_14020 [Planctomycetes bacterium]|nr:hypothetical protein [Planctomycetota bacterium]
MRQLWFIVLPCAISLMGSGVTLRADSVDARFDNLTTTLGLNDNFDDGVINPAIWSVEKARVGYGIWKLFRCDPPPFIAASEGAGQLRFSGDTCEWYDYARVLVSQQSFSGPFTLEVDLTSISGSGTQWGAGVAIVKDDFSAIQIHMGVGHWVGYGTGTYFFDWRARHSCISGTPGCPDSPGWQGTYELGDGFAKDPGPITLPIRLTVVYDGETEFTLNWNMDGVDYQYTHSAPQVYDTYRIVLHGSARLGDSPEVAIPAVSQWGLCVLGLLILTTGTLVLRRRAVCSRQSC